MSLIGYRRMPLPGRDRSGGFVLLELMLALAILALLTALALPRARLLDGPAYLGLKAQEIALLLRRDRDAALRGQSVVRTEIALAQHAIRSGAANGDVPVPSYFALRYEAREPAIRFNPDGSASGGTIFLAGQRATELVAVVIDDATGAVTVSRTPRDVR